MSQTAQNESHLTVRLCVCKVIGLLIIVIPCGVDIYYRLPKKSGLKRPALMAHSVGLWLESHRGCAYTVLQTVQRYGLYSAVYGTVQYEEPLKSFDKSRA